MRLRCQKSLFSESEIASHHVASQSLDADGFVLLRVGSFLDTVELLYLQLCLGAIALTIGALLFAAFVCCLRWESISDMHLN